MARPGNNLIHGLLSKRVLIFGEDLKSFQKLERGMKKDLAPGNELETLLVDQIVASSWRLQRAYHVESDYLGLKMLETGEESFASVFEVDEGTMDKIMRYKTGIEKSMYKAIGQLKELRQ